MSAAADRTERGTPKRRTEARRQGQVARSAELNSLVVLGTGFLLTLVFAPWMGRQLGLLSKSLFSGFASIRLENYGDAALFWRYLAARGLPILAPVVLGIFVAGTWIAYYQVGWKWNWSAAKFRLNKLNFFEGMKSKFLSANQLFELGKNLLKVGLLGSIAWLALRGMREDVVHLIYLPLDAAWTLTSGLVRDLALRLLAVLFVLAVADLWWQRHRYEESVKMTKQEVKQEHKDAEGDPRVRSRIRSMMLEVLRQRMLSDARQADVVITNPTHISIALKYDNTEPAPRVVAKGKGFLALRIREVARAAGVPIVEDKPLAHALYKAVKVGGFIPTKLFESVAKVLAAVYRAGKRGRAARA